MASDKPIVMSFFALRSTIGALGLTLPLALWWGAHNFSRAPLKNSLSDYFYSGVSGVFVGILCAIGVFLMACTGPERKDEFASKLAGISSIAVALLPTTQPDGKNDLVSALHFTFAAIFYLTVASMSIFLFTKTKKGHTIQKGSKKSRRNGVYRFFGALIIAAMAAIGATKLLAIEMPSWFVFAMESTANVSFGIAWLVKGEAILSDDPPDYDAWFRKVRRQLKMSSPAKAELQPQDH
jgi:hypothetical protein